MSITVYCGVMGSGKSYEVVSGPLLEAMSSGRRVVTNIDGVDEEAIRDYLHGKRGVSLDKVGTVVHVRTDDLNEEGFFPLEVESSGGAVVTPGFVQPGDLLVIDEAWKLWDTSQKIKKEHMSFFRMHRHFVHAETGVSCDVVMMIQSITDLHRSIKSVVELSFRMVKLKTLGASKRYRVEMYETAKQAKSTRTGTFVKRYKPEIFPLYKSYAGAGGNEAQVDSRQNVFGRTSLWVGVVVCVIAFVLGVYGFVRFFHRPVSKKADTTPVAGKASVPDSAASFASPSKASGASVSDAWRIVGGYRANGLAWVVLADEGGHLRVDSPSAYVGHGISSTGTVDGQRVTVWSGAKGGGLLPAPSNSGGSK